MAVGKQFLNTRDYARLLQEYYSSTESRVGYEVFLGGRRHFGYYEPGTKWPFPITTALIRMEDYLFDRLALPSGSMVLDAGCGAGLVALHMAHRGLRVQAIDIVEKHVHWAQRLFESHGYSKQATARVGDYHDLSAFADASLDGVYTLETCVHATDPDKVMAEFFRVLRPGGRIAMFEYEHMDPDDAYKIFPKRSKKFFAEMSRMNVEASMPANEIFVNGYIKEMMERHGFQDVTVTDLSENVKPLVRLFYFVAIIPWFFICLFGLQAHFVNTGAGALGYPLVRRRIQTYVTCAGTKPY